MGNNKLSIGIKVDVVRQDKMKNGDEAPVLSSKVVDILDEKQIVIAMPMDRTVSIPLRINERIECFFYTGKGMFSAYAKVEDRYKEGNLPLIKLTIVSDFEKLQRREYYRVECYIPFKFVVLEEVEVNKLLTFNGTDRATLRDYQNHLEDMEEEIRVWQNGVILDLSGGGSRFITETDIKKGDAILLSMRLQNDDVEQDIVVVSRIINVEEKVEVEGKKEIRARFYKLQDTLRDFIVKYVFNKERKARSMTNRS